jgi:hypothetical protein
MGNLNFLTRNSVVDLPSNDMNTPRIEQPNSPLSLPALPGSAPVAQDREAFPAERLRDNAARYLTGDLSNVTPDITCTTWAQLHLPVHGTTVDRAVAILQDGALHSYAKLQELKPHSVADNLTLRTDKLDIELGLHKYIFLNLGRVHPIDVHPVYFLFPNRIVEEPGTAVALREIVHFGALVSSEAAQAHRAHDPSLTEDGVKKRNEEAAREFFKNTFAGDTFISEIFPRFLQKNYPNVTFFTSSEAYPGTKLSPLKLGRELIIKNAWEGPQVTVPDSIDFSQWKPSVLITDIKRASHIESRLRECGIGRDRIYRMDRELPTYQRIFRTIGSYDNPLNAALYVNLALRDLALLACHNRFEKNFPDSMSGWKSRIVK